MKITYKKIRGVYTSGDFASKVLKSSAAIIYLLLFFLILISNVILVVLIAATIVLVLLFVSVVLLLLLLLLLLLNLRHWLPLWGPSPELRRGPLLHFLGFSLGFGPNIIFQARNI